MPQRFYRLLTDDATFGDRWFLGRPIGESGDEIDPRLFNYGRPYTGERPVAVPISYTGRMVQFNFAAFDMPVASQSVASIIREVSPTAVEFYPVSVGGMEHGAFILNVLSRCACLDEGRSKVTKWSEEDGRPDKIGQYKMVIDLIVEPAKARGHDIFRIEGWKIALIVSENLWRRLREVPDLGVKACCVT